MRLVGWAVAAALGASTFTGTAMARDHAIARGGYGYDTFRIGLDRGYEEGLARGRHDGRRGGGFRFSDDRAYRRGDSGYRSFFGPRYEYARGFRAGYERGYRRGYQSARGYGGYDRYGRDGDGRDRYFKDDPYGGY